MKVEGPFVTFVPSWRKSIFAMAQADGIRFVDTTIRDGHQSLWAENMTTGMMLPVAEAMDRAGFDAIELISSSHLKKCVRELKEDPWARVRLVRERITHTPLRLNAGRFSAFDLTPRSMYRLFMERMAANGIREARISEEWNELEGWRWKVQVAREVGINPVPNIIYSVSPKHTDDYFAERTRQAASLKVNRLCLKDPGGLLTPERVRTLVPIMIENAGGVPIELHTHCTTGLGPLCCLEAVRLGIRIVNTALPPLAAAGLTLSGVALGSIQGFMAANGIQSLPFWIDFDLSITTVLYVIALATAAAVIVGVLPLATAAMGALLHRQRPSAGFWACAAAGSALVVGFALLKSGPASVSGSRTPAASSATSGSRSNSTVSVENACRSAGKRSRTGCRGVGHRPRVQRPPGRSGGGQRRPGVRARPGLSRRANAG